MLSDKEPHKGVAEAHKMPVQGIDVSYFQDDIDWQKVSDAGIRFAFIKATEGGDRLDPKFLANWRGAKAAGMKVLAVTNTHSLQDLHEAHAIAHSVAEVRLSELRARLWPQA